ncbi:MAG: glutathione S-transferase N-terminal domain-containing protein [Patulibacter sp.]
MATTELPSITLHGLPPSPPCFTIEAALKIKGIPFERVDLPYGQHVDDMQALYGEGCTTVPGVMIGDEPVHGSTTIMPRIDELGDGPSLYPDEIAEAVRDAELWGEGDLQLLARHLPWGAMHFRPESLGYFAGPNPLDGAGTDFAIKMIRGAWRHVGVTAAGVERMLLQLPELLAHVAKLIDDGVIGGEQPNAADLQIGANLRSLLIVEDLHPLIERNGVADLSRRVFPEWPGRVPAGAYPVGWVPAA